MIHNIIFDWSGTLVDDLPAVLDATNHVLARADRPEMTLEEFRSECRLPFTLFYDKHVPHIPLPAVEAWFHGRFGQVQSSVSALPHAEDFLRFCRANDLCLFVLSAVSQGCFEVQAEVVGFGAYFQKTYVGVRDKRTRIGDILRENRLGPRETLFIGDMQHDIEAAKHGGIHSCAVLTGYNTVDQLRAARPDLIVEHLGELQEVLAEHDMCLPSADAKRHGTQPPIATVGALVFNQAGEVLMVRTHKWSNRWGIPGGKIRWGEPSEDALRREIREETGLEVAGIRFELVQDCIGSREFYREAHFILLNYTCRVAGSDEVRLNEEAQTYRWVPLQESLSLALNHPTRVLVEAVIARSEEPVGLKAGRVNAA
ncbi:MAG: NUDIX domain-containing protein [Verrucomicrobia bacterium]|nr:NUDIX domain-containing protein [Verrucomicrobiota bacterium]